MTNVPPWEDGPKQQLRKLVDDSSLFDVLDALSDVCLELSVEKKSSIPDGIALGLRRLKKEAQVALYERGGEIKEL